MHRVGDIGDICRRRLTPRREYDDENITSTQPRRRPPLISYSNHGSRWILISCPIAGPHHHPSSPDTPPDPSPLTLRVGGAVRAERLNTAGLAANSAGRQRKVRV